VTVYGLQKICFDPYKSEKHFCLNDTDFSVMPRLTENQLIRGIGMLQAGLAQDILAFIATRYSHCWGFLDNLATLGAVNIQVVHALHHVSKLTTYIVAWCICEINSRNQVTARSIPDYNQSLEQFAIDFMIVTSSHDIQQSVQCFCLGTVQLHWRGVEVIWDSKDRIGPISCSQMNPVST
jgi:hypothetical protein